MEERHRVYAVFDGGIGAGKSTAVAHLAARGARVIDLDQVAHEVLDEPAVKLALVERFGEDVLPGVSWDDDRRLPGISSSLYLDEDRACDYDDLADFSIDRAVLASRAFADEGSTRTLDAITHPRIMERLGEMLQVGGSCVPSVGEEAPLCVVEVPLIDAAGRGLADEVMTLACRWRSAAAAPWPVAWTPTTSTGATPVRWMTPSAHVSPTR